MARGEQLGRQWRIMQKLLSSRRGRSVAELSRDLDCHPRTVYRDLEALQLAGFPIFTEREGGRSLWSVLDTLKHQIPIPFSLPELMALCFGSDILKVFKGTFFYDSLETLFQKIKTTLPAETLRYLDNVQQTLHVEHRPYQEYGKFKEIINCVNEAAVKRNRLEMVYFTMSRRQESRRKVDPYRILFFNGTFYLIGYCHLRREVRIFALDRVKMLRQTAESFAVPGDFKLEDFLKLSFGVFRGAAQKVRVLFSPEIAGYIREKIWHAGQQLYPQKDGSLILEAVVAGTQEIKQWVLSWGAGARVLEPESLREEIRKEARAVLENYQAGKPATGRPLRKV